MSQQLEQSNAVNQEKVDKRKTEINKWSLLFNKLGIYGVIVALVLIGVLVSNGEFLKAGNIRSILDAVALIGMVASGLFFVTYSGNMTDMSIPLTMACSGMVAVQAINLGFPLAMLCGILTGAFIGLINGLMIGKLRANPIIWTWGFNLLLSGIVRFVWGGKQLYADKVANSSEYAQTAVNQFFAIGRTYIGDYMSLMAIVMIVMMVIAWFLHSKTSFGQKLKIIGTNYEVAKFSGINCTRTLIYAYIFNGMTAATGGIFFSALRKTSSYENGTGYDFFCLTAVLLGGCLLSGGKGSVVGVFGGVLAYGILNNILSWIGLGTYEKYLIQGLVFLLIVWLNTYSNRKLGKE